MGTTPETGEDRVTITDEACECFRRLACAHGLTLDDLFEQALDAWKTQLGPDRRLGAVRLPRP